jgi:hypothetical protein
LTAKARQIALGELDSSDDNDDDTADYRGSKRGREDGDEDMVMEDRKLRCLNRPANKKDQNKKPYTKFA